GLPRRWGSHFLVRGEAPSSGCSSSRPRRSAGRLSVRCHWHSAHASGASSEGGLRRISLAVSPRGSTTTGQRSPAVWTVSCEHSPRTEFVSRSFIFGVHAS